MAQYAVLKEDTIVSKWFPTQDQALFEAFSLGLVYRNKRTGKLYLQPSQNVRIVSRTGVYIWNIPHVFELGHQIMKWDGYPNV